MAMATPEAILDLVRRGRRRLRLQAALDGATAAAIGASVWAAAMVVLIRVGVVGAGAGVALLLAAPAVVAAVAIAAASRRHADETIARRIDRTSGLADRLATAIAFAGDPTASSGSGSGSGFREAAIRDAERAVPRAKVEPATPFRRPRATWAALIAAVVAVVIAVLLPMVMTPDRGPVPRRITVGAHTPPRGAWDTGYAHEAVGQLRRLAAEHHADSYVVLANILERALGSLEAETIDKEGLLDSLTLAERAAGGDPLVDEEVATILGDVSEAFRRVERRDPVALAQTDPPPPGTPPPPPPPSPPPGPPGLPGPPIPNTPPPSTAPNTPTPPPSPDPATGAEPGPDLRGLPSLHMAPTTDLALAGDRPAATGTRKSTISDAARRGFASAPYRTLFKDYESITEEVMHAENVPRGQRYIVKRYFFAIRPGS